MPDEIKISELDEQIFELSNLDIFSVGLVSRGSVSFSDESGKPTGENFFLLKNEGGNKMPKVKIEEVEAEKPIFKRVMARLKGEKATGAKKADPAKLKKVVAILREGGYKVTEARLAEFLEGKKNTPADDTGEEGESVEKAISHKSRTKAMLQVMKQEGDPGPGLMPTGLEDKRLDELLALFADKEITREELSIELQRRVDGETETEEKQEDESEETGEMEPDLSDVPLSDLLEMLAAGEVDTSLILAEIERRLAEGESEENGTAEMEKSIRHTQRVDEIMAEMDRAVAGNVIGIDAKQDFLAQESLAELEKANRQQSEKAIGEINWCYSQNRHLISKGQLSELDAYEHEQFEILTSLTGSAKAATEALEKSADVKLVDTRDGGLQDLARLAKSGDVMANYLLKKEVEEATRTKILNEKGQQGVDLYDARLAIEKSKITEEQRQAGTNRQLAWLAKHQLPRMAA